MEEFGPYATYQAAVDAKARIRGEMPQDFTLDVHRSWAGMYFHLWSRGSPIAR